MQPEFFRLVKPLPRCAAYRNARLFFLIKKDYGEALSIYACKIKDPMEPFHEKEYDHYSRVVIARAENRTALRRLTEEIGFCPPCDDSQRILRSLERAGYAVRI